VTNPRPYLLTAALVSLALWAVILRAVA